MNKPTRLKKSFIYSMLFLLLLIIVVPLLWAFSASFTPNDVIFKNVAPFSIKAFIPSGITFDAYARLFTYRDFGKVLLTTLLLSLGTIAIGGVMAFSAGFALARFDFFGKRLLNLLVLFTFMVPVEVIIIPQYIMMLRLNWVNTWQGLFIPGLANGLVIFLYKQFFMEFPQGLLEAARIDGARWPRILVGIVAPLTVPVSIGAALILFLSVWNNYFWPLVVATKPQFRVVQVAISLAIQEQQTFWNELFAGALIAAIVPVLLILPLQKYYIESIASSGIKE